MLTRQNLSHLSLMAGRHGADGGDVKLAPTAGTWGIYRDGKQLKAPADVEG
jgi:hypothetical protein